MEMLGALVGIHDMNCFVAAFEPILDERQEYAVLLLIAVEQSTNMTHRTELGSRK